MSADEPRINLAFHDIVRKDAAETSRYAVEATQLNALVEAIADRGWLPRTTLYFDDNLFSVYDLVRPMLRGAELRIVVAVPAHTVGLAGHCTKRQLQKLIDCGFAVASHGVSHSSLAAFADGAIERTPLGGPYANSPRGKDRVLSENEVLFQLVESYEELRDFRPDEFVLPYGLYNQDTPAINAKHGLYDSLGTCDERLDYGSALRPRLLMTTESALPTALAARIERLMTA